jgi:hypothetical protein
MRSRVACDVGGGRGGGALELKRTWRTWRRAAAGARVRANIVSMIEIVVGLNAKATYAMIDGRIMSGGCKDGYI